MVEVDEQNEQKPCWVDPENNNIEQQQIVLEKKNKFRKLINFGMDNNTNVE